MGIDGSYGKYLAERKVCKTCTWIPIQRGSKIPTDVHVKLKERKQ